MHFIGFDAGSVTIKLVVLDERSNKLEGHYIRHYGHPLMAALNVLKDTKSRFPDSSLSVTGSAGKFISSALGVYHTNEIVSQAYSIKKLHPHIKTIIELGGEDSKLIHLERGRIRDFSMNSVCAAGTGSFLEQQAERLKLTIAEFSKMAAISERPSKIAGRCSVFAKSDMIHLQQIATPVESIVAGLCFAVARNFKGAIVKGRGLKLPVAFQGGVAANEGMVRAFREVFGLDDLFVPEDFALMGALGAALKDMDEGRINNFDLQSLESFVSFKSDEHGHMPLLKDGDGFLERHQKGNYELGITNYELKKLPLKAYLGIDIGSISTNLAVIDENGKLLAKRYLMTAGRPIEAVKQGLGEINAEIGNRVEILGVGTTGSGRYMIADYVGADIVKNEITAQATAAIFIDPQVDTIFEIGGQDSKYISINDGIIVDFEMNKACAAGTGSFIEEQAEKLNISVKSEFAECAFASEKPSKLGERCTVFMENSLMANLQKGVGKNNLLAGLAYSIVQNYINRVVAGKPVGRNIFFQGGVAFNKAVVAAFEKHLDLKVTVPPNHDVTGAIGMALIAMRYMKENESEKSLSNIPPGQRVTKFKGLGLSEKSCEIKSFTCGGCPNVCEINRVKIHGENEYLFYGGRCEKYDVRKSQKTSLPDLFEYREKMLWKAHFKYSDSLSVMGDGSKEKDSLRIAHHASLIKIGIPYIFYFHDYLPFWTTLLWELGFEVVVSPKTNKQVITLGLENVLSEACFPIKVAHGHIKYLQDAGVDAIFIPSFINVGPGEEGCLKGLACPHTQTIPYVSRAAIRGMKAIAPIVDLSGGTRHLKRELLSVLRDYSVKARDIDRALRLAGSAQDEFVKTISKKGNDVLSAEASSGSPRLSTDRPVVIIVGRAYNAFDPGVNLEIPRRLANIDVLSVPMDFLLSDDQSCDAGMSNMYWRSGQKILKAARTIRNTQGLYAIYIGNFSCGPDSFVLKYFNEEMDGKPFLHIEIDEHSADAGAITRCEAFLDSIEQQNCNSLCVTSNEVTDKSFSVKNHLLPITHHSSLKKRTVFIPRMADHSFALSAAFEHCGVPAEILPESDRESVDIARKYVSGKECYPFLVTTGDMLRRVFSPGFRPEGAMFFMPSGTGPCRFGQYNVAQRLVLKKLGMEDIPIFSPNQDMQFYSDLGIVGRKFSMKTWEGIIAYELLTKCLHETRPYEKTSGEAEAIYEIYHNKIYQGLSSRNGGVRPVLKKMKQDFASLPRNKDKRPLIGVIGEIFVRSHKFSNEGLIKKIEGLGGEVWLAPIEEWLYYINAMSFRKALIKRDRSAMMNIFIKRLMQKRIEHRFGKIFNGFLRTLREPDTKKILKKAAPYVHDSFEGETVLSIGKAIDLIENGAAGIVNAMPFGCMPGTIVTALMKTINDDYGVPCISIPYDGTESPATTLQIEAFMEATHNR